MKKKHIAGLATVGFITVLAGYEGYARLTPGIPSITELLIRGATTNHQQSVIPSIQHSPAVSFAIRDPRGVLDLGDLDEGVGLSGVSGDGGSDAQGDGIGNSSLQTVGSGAGLVVTALAGKAVSSGDSGSQSGQAASKAVKVSKPSSRSSTRQQQKAPASKPVKNTPAVESKPRRAQVASKPSARPARPTATRSTAEKAALVAQQRRAYAEQQARKEAQRKRDHAAYLNRKAAREQQQNEHQAYLKRKTEREATEAARLAKHRAYLERAAQREASEAKRKADRADWLKRQAAKKAADEKSAAEKSAKDHAWCSKLNNRYEAVNKPGCVALGYTAKRPAAPIKKKKKVVKVAKAKKVQPVRKIHKKRKPVVSKSELNRRHCKRLRAAWKNTTCRTEFGYAKPKPKKIKKMKVKPKKTRVAKKRKPVNRVTAPRPATRKTVKKKMTDRQWCKHIGYSSKSCSRYRPKKKRAPKQKKIQVRMLASNNSADRAAERRVMMRAKCGHNPAAQGCKAFIGNPWKDKK